MCGAIFILLAVITLIMGVIDTAPEAVAAGNQLRDGNNPLPVATSAKYRIGAEVLTDLVALVIFALFGWFLWTSEIQQVWAVVITFLLVTGSVVVRVTPVLPMDIGRYSPGMAFWGALVIDDYYPSPLAPGTTIRKVETFPMNTSSTLAVTQQNLSGSDVHPGQSVVLNFTENQQAGRTFLSQRGGQIIGKLAGTRTILDWDHDKALYPVPHLMVEEVAPVGAGSSGG
jgi:hypothetical protein